MLMLNALDLFVRNLPWMGWNLFLAIIPLVISFVLFNPQKSGRRNWGWWVGLGVFTLFLPNAAYILTDIIHLISDIQEAEVTRNGLIFVILPQYIAFLIIGFQCHVLSVVGLTNYVVRNHLVKNAVWFELAVNFICAIGIYLGRFNRLNSWHILTKPTRLINTIIDNLDERHFFVSTLVFFAVISILYYCFKYLNLAFYRRSLLNQ